MIEENAVPPKGPRITSKWEQAFSLEPRDPDTKQGQAAVYPIEDHKNIVSSLLPRWNRDYAPKRWTSFLDRKDGKRVVKIQRMNQKELSE